MLLVCALVLSSACRCATAPVWNCSPRERERQAKSRFKIETNLSFAHCVVIASCCVHVSVYIRNFLGPLTEPATATTSPLRDTFGALRKFSRPVNALSGGPLCPGGSSRLGVTARAPESDEACPGRTGQPGRPGSAHRPTRCRPNWNPITTARACCLEGSQQWNKNKTCCGSQLVCGYTNRLTRSFEVTKQNKTCWSVLSSEPAAATICCCVWPVAGTHFVRFGFPKVDTVCVSCWVCHTQKCIDIPLERTPLTSCGHLLCASP